MAAETATQKALTAVRDAEARIVAAEAVTQKAHASAHDADARAVAAETMTRNALACAHDAEGRVHVAHASARAAQEATQIAADILKGMAALMSRHGQSDDVGQQSTGVGSPCVDRSAATASGSAGSESTCTTPGPVGGGSSASTSARVCDAEPAAQLRSVLQLLSSFTARRPAALPAQSQTGSGPAAGSSAPAVVVGAAACTPLDWTPSGLNAYATAAVPSPEEFAARQRIVDKLRSVFTGPALPDGVPTIVCGGSYGKGTAVKGKSDCDVVAIIPGFDPTRMGTYKEAYLRAVQAGFSGAAATVVDRETK